MDQLIELLEFANNKRLNSKEGLTTYEDDSEADHGDGVQVGREEAYTEVIKFCAQKIVDICSA